MYVFVYEYVRYVDMYNVHIHFTRIHAYMHTLDVEVESRLIWFVAAYINTYMDGFHTPAPGFVLPRMWSPARYMVAAATALVLFGGLMLLSFQPSLKCISAPYEAHGPPVQTQATSFQIRFKDMAARVFSCLVVDVLPALPTLQSTVRDLEHGILTEYTRIQFWVRD